VHTQLKQTIVQSKINTQHKHLTTNKYNTYLKTITIYKNNAQHIYTDHIKHKRTLIKRTQTLIKYTKYTLQINIINVTYLIKYYIVLTK